MPNYRKIWERYHKKKIPKDRNGRTYEIHHLDGDKTNNSIENLDCISIEEHYLIHALQGDWAACLSMSKRMQISPKEKSELASLSNAKRLANGEHPFLDPEIRKKARNGVKLFYKENPNFASERGKRIGKLRAGNYTSKEWGEVVKKGWVEYKEKNPNTYKDRSFKGAKAGAIKTSGTKWYHKPNGSQLRTTPDDPIIRKEGWIKGRFNGKLLSKKANNAKKRQKK